MRSETRPRQWCYTSRQPSRCCGEAGRLGGPGGCQRQGTEATPKCPSDGPLWAFQGPVLVIDVSALQFGLLLLGEKATNTIQIQNVSPLPATWCMKESPVCLQERHEGVSGARPAPPVPRLLPGSRFTRVVSHSHCETRAGGGKACLVTSAWQCPQFCPSMRQSRFFLEQD